MRDGRESRTTRHPRPFRILVVEDDRAGLAALTRIFRSRGYEVCGATDGQSGIALLATIEPPDVLLVDLILPDQDGREFCRIACEQLRDRPIVILMTGWVIEDEEFDLSRWGIDRMITKPLDIPTLLGDLDRILGEHPASSDEENGR